MRMTRRSLLGYGSASVLLLLAPSGSLLAAGRLRTSIVRDDLAAPRLRAGQTLLVDAGATRFSGDGLYLYPAWGQPRPYLVTARTEELLQFRNPATGQVLWEQSQGVDCAFAAQVLAGGGETPGSEGITDVRLAGLVPPLQVPPLPA